MKLSISKLRQIISEELESELQEKKKPEHFSASQSKKQAGETLSGCIEKVEDTVDPRPGTDKEGAAAATCTIDAKVAGTTLSKTEKYKRHLQRVRKGGLSGDEPSDED